MHHLNSALTTAYLYAASRAQKMRSDQGMSTIEYAFGSLAAAALAGVLYLVVSGAPAPEGIPALVAACQAAGWQVVLFSTPTGIRFIDPAELERLTGARAAA